MALGLLAAVRISEQIFSLSGDYSQRLKSLLDLLGLPTHFQGIDPGAVISAMSSDKKADDISANMVLLKTIGEPVINCDVDVTMLRREVERLAAGESEMYQEREILNIALLHGVNLNMLGKRDPENYGTLTLAELENQVVTEARRLGLVCISFQTNHEGDLVEKSMSCV